jgi:hypothetical protein
MGQTRRHRVGGAFLGEGLQGKTYDMGCDTEGESMCTMLEKNNVSEIRLELDNSEFVALKTKEDIEEFIQFLHTVTGKIAKMFKPAKLFSMKTLQSKLDEEVDFNKTINKIYGRTAKRYLTSDPVKGFRKLSIVGAVVTVNGTPLLFVVFGTKCTNVYDMDMTQFITDILSSLVKLQSVGYSHNDIKLDNIVRCTDRYKLIDWGKLSNTDKKFGTTIFTNPIKWYLLGYSKILSKNIYRLSKHKVVRDHPLFKANNKRIVEEFNEVVKTHTRDELTEIFKGTYDTFMFGNTILQAVIIYNLEYEKYRPLVESLTSLNNPLNAEQALKLVKKIKTNL